jgi:uncharacterized membrane protein YphA (DoxX/SURF4 family)
VVPRFFILTSNLHAISKIPGMSTSPFKSHKFLVYSMVALRIVIGWHFLYEGISKVLTPGWTSADYLWMSAWVTAPFFHWIAATPSVLAIVDFLNIVGLILIGISLLAGLLDRVAAIAGMTLLALFWMANPPLIASGLGIVTEGNYLLVDKNVVEFFALLLLALVPTGKYIGIAHFYIGNRNRKLEIGTRMTSEMEEKKDGDDPDTETVPDPATIHRRTMLRGLATLPIMGVFGLALLKMKRWKSYEEQNLVDAMTSASARVLNISSLNDLKQAVPSARIKDREFSRLILGGNLLSGWAHSRDLIYVSQLVKAYHQKEKIFATLMLAEKCGVNTLLTHPILCSLIEEYWKRGIGRIQFISDCAGLNYTDKGPHPMPFDQYLDLVKRAIDTGAVACYIQGETADYYMEKGDVDSILKVMDYVRSRGIICGIGAHRIETIKACVDAGLETDFWMKTLHHHNYWSARHPTWHDNMYCFKPDETISFMKQRPEPFIAFKVLAAGAIHPRDGFRYAYENGADFVCAGMYDFQMVDDVNIACDILNGGMKRERPWRA